MTAPASPEDGLRPWLRQAAGVVRAARTAQRRPPVAWRWARVLLAIQLGGAAVLAAGVQGVAGVVAAEAALLPASFTLFLVVVLACVHVVELETDLVREVEQGVLESLHPSPLAGSAWVAGKLAWGAALQAGSILTLMPALAACYLLGVLALHEIAALAALVVGATLLHSGFIVSGVLRAHARRLAGRKAPLGRRTSGLFAAGTFVTAFMAWGMATAMAMGGGNEAAPMLVVLGLLPGAPVASLLAPVLEVEVFGARVPLWATSLVLTAVLLPLALAEACLRFKPPRRATGVGLRAGVVVGVVGCAAVLAGLVRDPDAYRFALVAAPLALAGLVPTWAGASGLAAAGEGGRRVLGGLLSMRRDTAGTFGLATAGLAVAVLVALAPASRADAVVIGLLVLGGCLPVVALSAAMARCVPPSRPSAVTLAIVLVLSCLLLPPLPATVAGLGLQPAAADAADGIAVLLASAAPVAVVTSAAGVVDPDLALAGLEGAALTGAPVLLALAAGFTLLRRRRERAASTGRAVRAAS